MAASRPHARTDTRTAHGGGHHAAGRRTRPRRRARNGALLLAIVGVIAGALALVPAPPAHAAVTNPVLLVGGHATQSEWMEGWADFLDDAERLDLADDKVRGIELRTHPVPPWDDLPVDDPDYGDWPGTASNEASAADILAAINDLSGDYGGARVEVIAISQGALATRWLLQSNPAVRSKVASFVSLSGVNAGIPDVSSTPWAGWLLGECEDEEWIPVCEEMIYDTPLAEPGETEWIEDEVNMWDDNPSTPNGDPTPGGPGETPPDVPGIAYYHLYTAYDPGAANDPVTGLEVEATRPYGWSVPLLGAANRSVQDDCGAGYPVPHAAFLHQVFTELVLDALNRRTLDAPASLC